MSSGLFGRWDATIDVLLREAARVQPGGAMSPERLSFMQLDALADHHAARWREAMARLGDAAVLIAAPTAQSFASLVGALRAGLVVSLAPPEIDARELDSAVAAAEASILAGPTQFAGIPIGDVMCSVAVDQERIALVASHGGRMSGVLALDGVRESETIFESRSALAQIRVIEPRGSPFARFDEGELIDAAGAIVSHARIARGDAILSTLSCASAAGLAAGPLAALVAGARLTFHAPFDARAFLAAVEGAEPVHLVVPEMLTPMLETAGLISDGRIASLILSCAGDSPGPTLRNASSGPPEVYVSSGSWGGLRVESAAQRARTTANMGEQNDRRG